MHAVDAVWTPELRALWQRLEAHDFGTADCALTFARRLAREHGWSEAYAEGALREYRRFCFLAVASGHVVTPSDAVDEVWHQHLTYSRDYWQRFCPEVLQRSLHHDPTRGGAEQGSLHRNQYAQTLASYQHWFGPPPEGYWPDARTQARAGTGMRRVDLARYVVLRRPALPRLRWPQLAAAAALAAVAPLLQALPLNPLDLPGPQFLGLFLLLMLIGGVVSFVLRKALRREGQTRPGPALDAWSAAYLAGGSRRLFDAGLATLMSTGQAQWLSNERRVHIDDPDARRAYPLDEIARAASYEKDFNKATARLDTRLEPLRDTLRARGLLLQPAQRQRIGLVGALPFALLCLLGIAKIGVGIARDRPVGLLIFLTLIALVVALLLLFKRPERSAAGDEALRQLNLRHAHARRAPRDSDMGMAVALAGTAVLAGTAYAGFHDLRSPQSTSSNSSDSSSGCSSDSGDSGGGGCGGCGGGD